MNSVFKMTEEYYSIEWMERELSNSVHQRRYEEILKLCKGKILDVGAGIGSLALKLKEKGFDVTCIDRNTDFVEHMKKKGLNAFVCDIEQAPLPFPEKHFDTVIIAEVLEHLENPGNGLLRCFGACKGKVIFTVPKNTTDKYHVWLNNFKEVDNFLLCEFIKV